MRIRFRNEEALIHGPIFRLNLFLQTIHEVTFVFVISEVESNEFASRNDYRWKFDVLLENGVVGRPNSFISVKRHIRPS